jgi:enoyl-CoA hydratase/carnithine racemase
LIWLASSGQFRLIAPSQPGHRPLGAALEMLYTGGRMDAQEAYRVGLVNHVVAADELMSKCEQIAAEIVKSAPLAVQKMKSVVMQGLDMPLSEAVKLEHEYFEWLMQTEDAKEGTRAFAEKRAPNWKAK